MHSNAHLSMIGVASKRQGTIVERQNATPHPDEPLETFHMLAENGMPEKKRSCEGMSKQHSMMRKDAITSLDKFSEGPEKVLSAKEFVQTYPKVGARAHVRGLP